MGVEGKDGNAAWSGQAPGATQHRPKAARGRPLHLVPDRHQVLPPATLSFIFTPSARPATHMSVQNSSNPSIAALERFQSYPFADDAGYQVPPAPFGFPVDPTYATAYMEARSCWHREQRCAGRKVRG